MRKLELKDLEHIYISPGLTAVAATTNQFRSWLHSKLREAYDLPEHMELEMINEDPDVPDTPEGRTETINQLIDNGIRIVPVK